MQPMSTNNGSRLMAQAAKEWNEFKKDRLSMALAFILPLFSILLFGFGIKLAAKNIPIIVQDNDKTYLSREYVARLYATNLFEPALIPPDKEQKASGDISRKALDKGWAKASLTIPQDFSKNLMTGKSTRLDLTIDGCDIANTQLIKNCVHAATLHFGSDLKAQANGGIKAPPVVDPYVRVWFNPTRSEQLFIVPGSIAIILFVYPALLAAVAFAREKEQATIVRVFASGINGLDYVGGKIVVYFGVGIIMALVVLMTSYLVFDVHPLGNFVPLAICLPLYVLCAVLFGLMIGNFASSQTVAVQAISTLGFFPCLLLSGFVYPIKNIPFPVNLFSVIVPARYFVELSRDAFVRGSGWDGTAHIPLAIGAFILLFFALNLLRLRKMQMPD